MKDLFKQLPIERLDQALRMELEHLLASDPETFRLQDMLRVVVEELLRSGDLVKVEMSNQTRDSRAFFLVRGTSRLIDLNGNLLSRKSAAEPALPDPRPEAMADGLQDRAFEDLISIIDAMEFAQNLDVGDPRGHEAGLLVARILSLLQGIIPQIRMSAQLHGLEEIPQDACDRLLPSSAGTEMFWLGSRRPGQVFWISDHSELPHPLGQMLSGSVSSEAVTAVIPLLSPLNDNVEIGILYVSARPTWSRERLLTLGRRLADFVTNRWRRHHDVNRRVLTDSLTGIHNRAFYDIQFPLELERARRASESLMLVLCDLDRFKAVNDTYGHPCGDLVLRTVACRLLNALRRIDHVCRIGGEEFACVLPSTSSSEAKDVLSRLVGLPSRIALPPEMGVSSLTVTMSYGAVCYPDAGISPNELHRKADEMLYQAKRLGRNRCCLWMPDGRHQMLLPKRPIGPAA